MKKIAFFLSFFFIASFLVSCFSSDEYSFLHDVSKLDNITIVEVGADEGNGAPPELKCIITIEEEKAFLEEFLVLECYKVWDDPSGVYLGEYAIKFEYQNGDYELISESGQARYSYSEYYKEMHYDKYHGWYVFYGEELKTLIMKYIDSVNLVRE